MNQTSNTGVCAVCQKQKFQLRPKKSKLMNGQVFFVCNPCFDAKAEPRWLIILIGQRDGQEAVRDFLLNKKYIGPDITAAELLK